MPHVADMSDRSVSVVVPAYNCESFVAEAIDSVLAQTRPPLEVIVVDDGSTDGTLKVLGGFGNRIRVFSHQNRGPSATRNRGVSEASGEWVAFLDADDTWLPTKLERQFEVAADPAMALVYTDRLNVGARGALPEVQGRVQHLYSGDVFVDLLLGNHISLSSVVIRTDVFRSLNGFPEHIRAGEDWDLWIRVAERSSIGVCPEPLVRYRFHGGMASGDPRHMRDGRNEVIRRALESPRGRSLPAATRRRVLASVALTNANDASKRKSRGLALTEYARAVAAAPWELGIYKDILRFLLGRHA